MIAVVDYGMGNLRSVEKAIQHVGGKAQIVRTPDEISRAGKIVLPGVGAFSDAIAQLGRLHLVGPLIESARDGTPFLGICLGLQLMFDVSGEDGEHTGLGIFSGRVRRFRFGDDDARSLRIPHMGWNRIRPKRRCPLFAGIENGEYMYFAHSYHVVPTDESIVAATTEYGYEFASAVRRGNVFGTQFHPEKSHAAGLTILRNFVNL